MNCGFTEKISSLIDGELAPAEAREIERHLLTCTRCEEARADFLNLRSQIAGFESPVPPAVHNRALAEILADGRRDRAAPAASTFGWKWNRGFAAIAFASLAIVAVIVGLISYQQPQQVAFQDNKVSGPEQKPSPEAEQPETEKPKTDKNDKEPDAPRRAPTTPVRRREPKPGEQFAAIPQRAVPESAVPEAAVPENNRPADAQTMTALHFERAETLLRAFRNVRLNESGAAREVAYERKRAQQLVHQNMMLRREADAAGDVQIASLLESLEPILVDIANLPDKPDNDTVRVIRERVERKNIVALLQINSTALARALD